jgi:hypothetical protein
MPATSSPRRIRSTTADELRPTSRGAEAELGSEAAARTGLAAAERVDARIREVTHA